MTPPMQYWFDPEAERIGVRFEVAVLRDVTVRREDPELESWKRRAQQALRQLVLQGDPILEAYRAVLAAAGNPAAVASPAYLLDMVQRSGRLPRINTLVDTYNVCSAQTRAVASAHDLERLTGPVRLVRLRTPAPFHPLGAGIPETLPAGEFGVRDDRHMLCRLNCKQSRLSSVGLQTTNVLVYVQGNPALEGEALRAALDSICEAIRRFNGGWQDAVTRRDPPAEVCELWQGLE